MFDRIDGRIVSDIEQIQPIESEPFVEYVTEVSVFFCVYIGCQALMYSPAYACT